MRYISDREIAEAFRGQFRMSNTFISCRMNADPRRDEVFNVLTKLSCDMSITANELHIAKALKLIKADKMPNADGKAFMRQWLKDCK